MFNFPEPNLIQLQQAVNNQYALDLTGLEPLNLGADPNTVLFLARSKDHAYFLKLRSANFTPLSLCFPKLLKDQGLKQIIAPLPTQKGELYTHFDVYKLMLFPFIEGISAYQQALSPKQWQSFGSTLRKIHGTSIAADLEPLFPKETFSAEWRNLVRDFLERIQVEAFSEKIAQKTAELLLKEHTQLSRLVQRADELALELTNQALTLVPCHADLHAGNLHLTKDRFYLVDWDTLILAPKERDLMFIGGALLGSHVSPEEEKQMFYQGYGETTIVQPALAYFRYERIIQDIAVYCQELLESNEGTEEDRAQSLNYLASNFFPGSTIDQAYAADN
ncbi:MAG: aminoglycoside phosphotransferase family protein [Trueperaceae bacterium]|nr:aminoglycoside phosphotransferase family protein [Trueperaceae bacterium]